MTSPVPPVYLEPVVAGPDPEVPSPEPQTAQHVAATWVEAVMDRQDLRAAWPMTDGTLRLVLAQDWIWAHRHHPWVGHDADWEGLAAELSASAPDHPLWERFAGELLELWHKIWRDFEARSWRAWDEPEVLGLDLEVVTFVERDDAATSPRHSSFVRRFALRHTDDGWKVAGVNGDQMFVPGWPPSLEDQPR